MNMSFLLFSGVAAAPVGAAVGGMTFSYIISIVAVLIVFYYLIVNPTKKKQKKQKEMLDTMEVGDVVMTTSDFYGVLIDITEEDVIVEFGSNKNCRIPMRKTAIAEVFKAEKPTATSCTPADNQATPTA